MALSNEDVEELFSEASGELQTEVEDALGSVRESLPAREILVAEEDTALNELVGGLPADLDPSAPAEALRTAQKRFALGEQADAFDDEFSEEATQTIEELENAVNALRTVGHTAPELAGALTTLREVHPDTQTTQTESPSPEPEESVPSESPTNSEEDSPVASDADADEHSAQQAITEESAPTDEDADGTGANEEDDEPDTDD